jgi:hypothetical protein
MDNIGLLQTLAYSKVVRMDEGLIGLLGMIGIPFCFAGGLTAFLITYEGYMRSEKPNKRLAFREAIQTALVTLAAFVVLVIGIAFALVEIILK